MSGNTKNLGQVSGVHVGNTPPENTILIWYDDTPNQRRHKVYDYSLGEWVVLDKNMYSSITYSELVNLANSVGLSVGQYFQIRDKQNALAMAITNTKVQYDDEFGNILIDDLGTNIQYHVTSSNLQIDDVSGVFDETNKILVFQFNELAPDFTADDYILGKAKRNDVWKLAKYKLSSFLSKVTGNSITWNGGFFFDFDSSLKDKLDKKGGVVSKETYDNDSQQLNQNFQNFVDGMNEEMTDFQADVDEQLENFDYYGQKIDTIPSPTAAPSDIAVNDTLRVIVAKIQRYINKFKLATGVNISSNFIAPSETMPSAVSWVNNNDTVESAFVKIQNLIKWIGRIGKLSSNWTASTSLTEINVAPGDNIDTAFSKISNKFNQIGTITDGLITKNGVTTFNLKDGILKFIKNSIGVTINNSGITINNGSFNYSASDGKGSVFFPNSLFEGINIDYSPKNSFEIGSGSNAKIVNCGTLFYSDTSRGSSALLVSSADIVAALSANIWKSEAIPKPTPEKYPDPFGSNVKNVVDAFFNLLKVNHLFLGYNVKQDSDVITNINLKDKGDNNLETPSLFINFKTGGQASLPTSPQDGSIVIIRAVVQTTLNNNGNSNNKIFSNELINGVNSLTIPSGQTFAYIFCSSIGWVKFLG